MFPPDDLQLVINMFSRVDHFLHLVKIAIKLESTAVVKAAKVLAIFCKVQQGRDIVN